MKTSLDEKAEKQMFLEARTYNQFHNKPVSDEALKALYNLLRWGPTALNCQPARFLFLKSEAAKERLKPALSPGNLAKTMAAPVVAICALDTRFYENLPTQWTAYESKSLFEKDPELRQSTCLRNANLGAAYLIMAARLLGLDCGPMSGFDNALLDKEFFPDGRFKSNFLVNMGYGLEGGYYPRGPRLEFSEAAQIL